MMTPEEKDLIFSLVAGPGMSPAVTKEDILKWYRTSDGRSLGLRLLQRAVVERLGEDLEAAIIVCKIFEYGTEHLETLINLVPAAWHQQHENVVRMLADLKKPEALPALRHAARWVPDYLEWDESRALAVKAIWGIGALSGSGPEEVLRLLCDDENAVVRQNAAYQLERRNQ